MRVGEDLNQKVNELTMYREVIRTVPKKVADLEYYKNTSKFKRLSPEWMEL
jgi:hypothetical protein